MSDDSHTAYDPYPTAAMDRQHREEAMEHTEYVLASINRDLIAERDRLREGVGTALQVIPERFEDLSPVQKSRIIRKVQAVLIALQEDGDAPRGEG